MRLLILMKLIKKCYKSSKVLEMNELLARRAKTVIEVA